MEPLRHPSTGGRPLDCGTPVAAALLLLAALTARADTPYTATGWVIGVPLPGIWCTNALGQVGIRGNAHLVRVESTDARLTGRRTIFVEGAAQADGSSIMYGPLYHEVGTWDATGTNFTPTGGMWELSYRGTMGADGSLDLHIVGYGWGATIDGLRLDETLTRAAGPILDPSIPYLYTGTIKQPPLNTNLVFDDFSGPAVCWNYFGPDFHSYTRTDGQLVVVGYWPEVVTRRVYDSYTLGAYTCRGGTAADGQTLEARVDLVNQSESATIADLALGTPNGFYAMWKGHNFVCLQKYSISASDSIVFSGDYVTLPDTNVVLSLALTKAGANAVLTGRVLDKGNPCSVLYERSIVDTPNVDPTLTSAQLLSLSGMNLAVSPDFAGAPFTSGGAIVGIIQYNNGALPAAVVAFDNYQLWQYENSPLAIARAVQLTWPAPAGVNYCVQTAPTVLGPWLPVQEGSRPGMQQVTVPTSEAGKFFRLREAP